MAQDDGQQAIMNAAASDPERPAEAGPARPGRSPLLTLRKRFRAARRRRSRFILEVETDRGWQPVTLFRRPDEARAQLKPVAGMMPHLRLRVSKDFTPEIARIERHRLIALTVKIVCLGLSIALFSILFMAWLMG